MHVVPLGLHFLEHPVDGAEDIEIGGRAHVPFVGREAENGDGELFVLPGLDPQGGPANGTFGNGIDAVLQGVGLARGVITPGENDRLNRTIQFGNGDLQGHLNGVETKVAVFPFLRGLEHQGQRHHVGAIQPLQGIDGLGVILSCGSSYQGETCEGDDAIHEWLFGIERVVKEGVDRLGEVETTAENRQHPRTAELQFLNDSHVMGIVTGDDVAALQHQANHRAFARFVAEVVSACRPIEVLLEILKHRWRHGVPDPQIWEHLRISHLHGRTIFTFRGWEDVFIRKHQQEVAEVVGSASQPILKTQHEAASILRLLYGQVLEHRGQGVQELEHRVLEPGSTRLLPLLHEASDGALALSQLGHREAAQLVKAHHLGHGGEDHRGLEAIAVGRHRIHHLLSQIFNENQRCNENVCGGDISLEIRIVIRIAQLLNQIAAEFDAKGTVLRVQAGGRLGEGVLVLRLKHHIDSLHH